MPTEIEVHIDFAPGSRRVGTLYRQARRGGEATSFEYDAAWLADPDRFSLEPTLTLHRGAFAPAQGLPIFGSIGDSAPDTWGRRLQQFRNGSCQASAGFFVRTRSQSPYSIFPAMDANAGKML
jgi:serine/threonine-protein kinase HipA